MKLKIMCLLSKIVICLNTAWIAPIWGAEFEEPALKSRRLDGDTVAVAAAIDESSSPKECSPAASRSSSDSTCVREHVGGSIRWDSRGIISIRQPKYPEYKGMQNYRVRPKPITPMLIDEGNQIQYQIVSYDEADGPFYPTTVETVLDGAKPFTIVIQENVNDKPYSSSGRLTMLFTKSSSIFYGSGAAIDKNLVITAAHNVLPEELNGHPNVDRERAVNVEFEHMLMNARTSTQRPVAPAKVSTHCFVHPEWEKSFDPKYDVALIFLSESLELTHEREDDLVDLIKILNGKKDRIQIVRHPKETVPMRESEGKTQWEQSLETKEIIYHFAIIVPGSSGSPIIADKQYVTGTHTCWSVNGSMGSNCGVRMRWDLIHFIEDSISKHQAYLIHQEDIEQQRLKEKQRQKQALIDQGKNEGKIEIARGMLAKKMNINLIAELTKLTEKEVSALKECVQ